MTGSLRRVCRTLVGLAFCLVALPGCWSPVYSGAGAEQAKRGARTATQRRNGVAVAPTTASDTELKINGEVVEPRDIWWGQEATLRQKRAALSDAAFRDYVSKRSEELLRDHVAQLLLAQEAEKRLPPNVDKRLESYIEGEIRKTVASQFDGRRGRYVRHLESQGRTLDDVRRKLRREVLISTYLDQEIDPKIDEPTRPQLLAEYQAAVEISQRPARRRMSLIDVRIAGRIPEVVKNPTREQVDAARADALSTAQAALDELRNGADFAEVVARYSDGLHAKEDGRWGWLTKGSVRPRFQPAVDALYTLQEGKTSDIIDAGDGFFLVRCDEIDEPETPDFVAWQPRLKEEFRRREYGRLVAEKVNELRGSARIEPSDVQHFYAAVVEAALSIVGIDTH